MKNSFSKKESDSIFRKVVTLILHAPLASEYQGKTQDSRCLPRFEEKKKLRYAPRKNLDNKIVNPFLMNFWR